MTKFRLVFVLNLIGEADGASLLDQLHGKVKQNP